MPRATKSAAPKSAATSKRSKAAPAKAAPTKAGPTKASAKARDGAKKATKAAPRAAKSTKAGTSASSRASSARAATKGAQPAKKGPGAVKARSTAAPVLDKFLEEQQALLLSEREQYRRQAASLKEEAERLAEEMEPGDIQFDEESGEGGTMNVERERDLALSAQARAAVDDIDRALEKITLGTYGICEQCGQPIPKARLKAIPQAALCVACKSGGLSRR